MKPPILPLILSAVTVFGCNSPDTRAQYSLGVAFPNLSFQRPVDLQHAGDGTDRLFVVEQAGRILVFDNDPAVNSASSFLDIRGPVDDSENEEGLLGLAFHPDYATNGFFYVNYTASRPNRTVISRFSVKSGNADEGDPASETVLLSFAQPYGNHNGGQVQFGPDGMLYIAVGDGGSGGDPQGHGQNRTTLLGTILRIDVDSPDDGLEYGIPPDNPFVGNQQGYREEIFAYGLRNPWRLSFDVQTGTLWTADVGQNRFEEIDIVESGGNYGWNVMEGNECFGSSGCNSTGFVAPVHVYGHGSGNGSITGGYVYRGSALPGLFGAYVYADYLSGRIWALSRDGNDFSNEQLFDTSIGISSFGVDEDNELFICGFDGRIHKLVLTSGSNTSEPLGEALTPVTVFPNPFRDATTFSFFVEEPGAVQLDVYDAAGRLVVNLMNGWLPRGEAQATWTGLDAAGRHSAAGVYLLRLRRARVSETVPAVYWPR